MGFPIKIDMEMVANVAEIIKEVRNSFFFMGATLYFVSKILSHYLGESMDLGIALGGLMLILCIIGYGVYIVKEAAMRTTNNKL